MKLLLTPKYQSLRLRRNYQFDSLFSRAGLVHLGKGWIVRDSTLDDCLIGLTGSSTRAGAGCTKLHLIGSSLWLTATH